MIFFLISAPHVAEISLFSKDPLEDLAFIWVFFFPYTGLELSVGISHNSHFPLVFTTPRKISRIF